MLTNSRLKLERANRHIADVKAIAQSLPDAYIASIEKDPRTGGDVIQHALPQDGIAIRESLALVIGDAIHNLKTALDFAWIDTLTKVAPCALSNFAKFPVYNLPNDLEAALKGRKIHTSNVGLYNLVCFEIRPYEGGNDSIWAIHRLDIVDKHRLLIPLIKYTSISGIELEDENGRVEQIGTWAATHSESLFIPIPSNFHIKKLGKVNVEIILQEGLPMESFGVSDALQMFAKAVLTAVQSLEQRFA